MNGSLASSPLASSRITPPLQQRLSALAKRHDEILAQLNDNTLDPKNMSKASIELANIAGTKSLYEEWKKSTSELQQLETMLSSQEDKEMAEMAREELQEVTSRIGEIERDLITELAPKDTADEASAILEIRAGVGGDEAALFTAEMANMYERFAQLQRWKWEPLSKSEGVGFKGLKVCQHA